MRAMPETATMALLMQQPLPFWLERAHTPPSTDARLAVLLVGWGKGSGWPCCTKCCWVHYSHRMTTTTVATVVVLCSPSLCHRWAVTRARRSSRCSARAVRGAVTGTWPTAGAGARQEAAQPHNKWTCLTGPGKAAIHVRAGIVAMVMMKVKGMGKMRRARGQGRRVRGQALPSSSAAATAAVEMEGVEEGVEEEEVEEGVDEEVVVMRTTAPGARVEAALATLLS